jgi:hypothetical protein
MRASLLLDREEEKTFQAEVDRMDMKVYDRLSVIMDET